MIRIIITIFAMFCCGVAFADLQEVSVESAVDFNIFKLNDGQEVRLIGIQSLSDFGRRESQIIKERIDSAHQFYLEFDVQQKDEKGRLLAYVWDKLPQEYCKEYKLSSWPLITLINGYCYSMLNAEFIILGHVQPFNEQPNIKYAALFQKIYKNKPKVSRMGFIPIVFRILPEDQICGKNTDCILVEDSCLVGKFNQCASAPVNRKYVMKYRKLLEKCLAINNARDYQESSYCRYYGSKCVDGVCIALERELQF